MKYYVADAAVPTKYGVAQWHIYEDLGEFGSWTVATTGNRTIARQIADLLNREEARRGVDDKEAV